MVFQKPRVNRLAAPESLVYAVPELDACFAQLPAQVNFFTLEQGGKVDEPDIEILYHATELVNSFDSLLESGSHLFPMVLSLQQLNTIHSHTAHHR